MKKQLFSLKYELYANDYGRGRGGMQIKNFEENSCCINFVAVVSEVNGVCMGRLLERDIIKENIRGIN